MGWLSGGYLYRKPLVLTGGASGVLVDFQLDISIAHVSGKIQADFDDIRFTQADGTTTVDAWLESKVDSTSADVWVEFPTTPANTVKSTYYMYYGKSDAVSDWDIEATFPFADDFPGSSLDTAKWNSSGTITVGSSEITLNQDDIIQAKTAFGFGYTVFAKSKADEQDTCFVGWRATIGSNANSQDITNSDYNYPNDFDRFNCNTNKAGANKNNYRDGWDDFRNAYKIYKIQRISSSSTRFWQETNTFNETESAYIPTVDMGACLLVWDSSQASTLTCDWVFVAKSVASPPTYEFGAEESAPTFIPQIIIF